VSAPVFADLTDVDVNDGDSATSTGADLVVTGISLTDGQGLIAIVGVADDNTPTINSVKAFSGFSTERATFIKVGDVEAHDMLLAVYKCDNKSIEDYDGNPNASVDIVKVDGDGSASHLVCWVGAIREQDQHDMIRNLQTATVGSGVNHGVDDVFCLEPNARVLCATFWNNGSSAVDFNKAAGMEQEHFEWEESGGGDDEGMYIFSDHPAIPVPATTDPFIDMDCTSSGALAGCQSVNVAIVLRSDEFINATHGAPATVATVGPTGAQYWLEGMARNDKVLPDEDDIWEEDPDDHVPKDRDDLDYGDNITEEKFIWIHQSICEGEDGTGKKSFGLNKTLKIMGFSPLAADREADWAAYQAGLEAALLDSDGENQRYGQIFDGGGAFDPDDWTQFRGVVQWDHEDFFMNFDGADGGGDQDRGHMEYDPLNEDDETNDAPWEYDAACRYFWERVHQWFTEVFAPDVEALIFYHHPWQPLAGDADGGGPWNGQPEDDQLEWLFRLQGSFDGHCYPPHALGYPEDASEEQKIHNWVSNVLGYFETMQDTNGIAEDLFCYVTLWPSRPGGATFHSPGSLTQMIDAIADAWDGGWEEVNVAMLGVPGLGGNGAEKYPIKGYDQETGGAWTEVRIELGGASGPAGTRKFQFDPRFEEIMLDGTTNGNDGHYNWDFDNGWPMGVLDTDARWYCDIQIVGDTFTPFSTGGDVIRRARTWDNWIEFWGEDETSANSFLKILEDRIGD